MRTPAHVLPFLAVGIFAASQSGNIIRLGDAHPIAIAAWRLAIASLLLAPLAGRRLAGLARLSAGDWLSLVLAGTAIAGHFFTWIAAVQRTTVANAAVFFAINPVMTAAAGWVFFGEKPTRGLVASVVLGLAGVAVLGWADLDLSPENLAGDAFAIACSVLFTAYFLLGKRVRRVLDNRAYVTALYGVAALVSFGAMAFLEIPFVGYSDRTWLCFGLMALVPTMVGHTAFNYALKYLPAGRISAMTLAEPLLAGAVAWVAWDEPLGRATLAGYVLVSLSVLAVVIERRRAAG